MWIVFALFAALTAAIVVVLSKAGIKNLDSNLAFAIESVLILIVSWSAVVIENKVKDVLQIERKVWIYLIIAGVVTAVSSLLTFRALKLGNASAVSPLERLSLVFAIIFASLFLKERITWPIIIGAALMVAGAVIIAVSQKSS